MTTVRNNADYIPEMVRRIVEAVHPLQIILFGSHARGDARPDSDVDLLVVMRSVGNRNDAAIAIGGLLSDMPAAKDILVATPDDLERRGHLVGSVFRSALRDGKVLYAA